MVKNEAVLFCVLNNEPIDVNLGKKGRTPTVLALSKARPLNGPFMNSI